METVRRMPPEKRLRLRLRQQVGWGRNALLAMMAVTLVNQFLLLLHVEYHFLISAAVPYYLNWLVRELGATGAFPGLATVVTVLLYGAYLVCWFQSVQCKEWLIAALGLYGLDTLLLAIFAFTMLENPSSCLLELLTHGVIIAVLAAAVRAADRLSRMPKPRWVPQQELS